MEWLPCIYLLSLVVVSEPAFTGWGFLRVTLRRIPTVDFGKKCFLGMMAKCRCFDWMAVVNLNRPLASVNDLGL
jgi:hypothetical protein